MDFKIDRTLREDRPVLPEWTRWAWSSIDEKDYWETKFKAASDAWYDMEYLSVVYGLRDAAYKNISADILVDFTNEMKQYFLTVIPVSKVNVSNVYQSGTSGFDPKLPLGYRVLISKKGNSFGLDDMPNDNALGKLLGFPDCCREFFSETWAKGQVDTTWDQYARTGNANGFMGCNVLWRFMNIRAVFHLPCSYQCVATKNIADRNLEVMRKHGFVDESNTIRKVLNWKTTWSAVNGIAEIVGPCLKVSTRTDWAPPTANRRFTRLGESDIPWNYPKPKKEMWTLNGFKTYKAMFDSHKPVIKALTEFAPRYSLVLDVGCGNGQLLRELKLRREDVAIGGIDINKEAIDYAKRQPDNSLFFNSEMRYYHLVEEFQTQHLKTLVYSPVRLLEYPEKDRELIWFYLKNTSKNHIIYSYADNNQKKTLPDWVREAGLPVENLLMLEFLNPLVSVGILRF